MSRVAVVVVSDRAARGERADGCMAQVREWASGVGHEVVADTLVADEGVEIERALRRLCDGRTADLVLTCGGTGFGPRDVTPEATLRVVDRLTPGLDDLLRRRSAEIVPTAMLSRAVSGLAGSTLVLNLPGSPRAVREQLEMLNALLPHALDVIRGGDHEASHTAVASPPASASKTKVASPPGAQGSAFVPGARGCGHTHRPSVPSAANGGGAHPPRRALIERDEALRLVLTALPELGVEEIALVDAAGRIAAADVICRVDEPAFARSAMDGYAYPAELIGAVGWIEVAGEVHAGAAPPAWMHRDAVARILTGAPLGDGLVGVIPQEDVEVEDTGSVRRIRFREPVAAGDCVRPRGHSLPRGTRLVARGAQLGARELTVLASAGEARLRVKRAHRVMLASTGDEIVPLTANAAELLPGRIFDSNSPLLRALLAADGLVNAGTLHVPDTLEATIVALRQALREADTVLTMGGISVGDRDQVAPALAALGARDIVRGVNFRPGRPFSVFAAPSGQLIFALPGNPLSVLATYVLFVRPVFDALHGRTSRMETAGRAPARAQVTSAIANPGGRWWAALSVVSSSGSRLMATVDEGSLDSGSLLPLTQSTAFALLPPGAALLPGDEVDIFPLVRGSIL